VGNGERRADNGEWTMNTKQWRARVHCGQLSVGTEEWTVDSEQ